MLERAGFHLEKRVGSHDFYRKDDVRFMISRTRQNLPKTVEARIRKLASGELDSRTYLRLQQQGRLSEQEPDDLDSLQDNQEAQDQDQKGEVITMENNAQELVAQGPRSPLLQQLEEFKLTAEIEREEIERLRKELCERVEAYRAVFKLCQSAGIDIPPPGKGAIPLLLAPEGQKKRGQKEETVRRRLLKLFSANGNRLRKSFVGQRFGGNYAPLAYQVLEAMPGVTMVAEGDGIRRHWVYVLEDQA